MTIGDNIKMIRTDKKLTQETLAKRMGISRSYLSDIENNRKNPSSKTINSLAEKLNITMLYLTTGKKALSDLTDDERKKSMRNVQDSMIKHHQDMKLDLQKDIEQLTQSELNFTQTMYLTNMINYLMISNDDDIGFLAAFVSQLNSYYKVGKNNDVDQDELLEFIDEGIKELKIFLKNRFHYNKEGD